MALFFDHDWFDERLRRTGLTRATLAQVAGMSIDEVELVFRDQRELAQTEVRAIAAALDVDPDEVADRSGVPLAPAPRAADGRDQNGNGRVERAPPRPGGDAGPPPFVVTREVIAGLHERMDRLERLIEVVITKLDRRN
ncbi:helix-turn-helix domain-containing protein [bacterium]|nr:helix-turn-helix domain-containing protein [bacterium]